MQSQFIDKLLLLLLQLSCVFNHLREVCLHTRQSAVGLVLVHDVLGCGPEVALAIALKHLVSIYLYRRVFLK